jgi:hypothetical protein
MMHNLESQFPDPTAMLYIYAKKAFDSFNKNFEEKLHEKLLIVKLFISFLKMDSWESNDTKK